MKFIRIQFTGLVLIIALFLVSCSSSPLNSNAPGLEAGSGDIELVICSQPPDSGFFDLQAASVMQVLIGDDELGILGQQGAVDLAADALAMEDSFCSLDLSEDLQAALDEIQALIDAEQDAQAAELFDDLLQEIGEDVYSLLSKNKIAAPDLQQGRTNARRTVRAFLAAAAMAGKWGNIDKMDDAMYQARETFSEWATTVIEEATYQEVITIAAEADLLGLAELRDDAVYQARELAEQAFINELMKFNPCSSSKQDADKLLFTGARYSLLGGEPHETGFMDDINDWIDIYKRRAKGEQVPECTGWQLGLIIDIVWDSGSHKIIWEGNFSIREDGTLDGQGQGTILSHAETRCVDLLAGNEFLSTTDVSGSFHFDIQGTREGSGDDAIFKFLLPAEVTVSGVDTCNPFDETAYLPKYVIEEINSAGGIENYDPASDKIFLVIPAQDGSQVEFETLIGPLIITLNKTEE